jgi:glycosyltransferase involved in cell wall biosynthesis
MPREARNTAYHVLMAGVVPPPVHGASLATQALFEADLAPIKKHLLEIRSSKNLEEVGRASLGKIFGLFGIIARCIRLRITSKSRVLYYTPGSASIVSFVRDMLFLGCCRPWFQRVLLHYHSGGLVDYLEANPVRKFIGRWIYGRNAWALTLSRHVAVPGMSFGAQREIEIPNGIKVGIHRAEKQPSDQLRILFLGNLFEKKGIFDLLQACAKIAKNTEKKIRVQFVGKWPDPDTEKKFRTLMHDVGSLTNLEVPEPGALYGEEKWDALAQSDLFVFPSYYVSENFPLVLLEAMAFGLPVISTQWRGIPSIVENGVTGFLHKVGDVEELSSHIATFLSQPHLLKEMGEKAKLRYQAEFTFEQHRDRMVRILTEACADSMMLRSVDATSPSADHS